MKDTNSDFVDRFVKDTILKRRHPICNVHSATIGNGLFALKKFKPGDHLRPQLCRGNYRQSTVLSLPYSIGTWWLHSG